MNKAKYILCVMVCCLISACVSNENRTKEAIEAGNLKEAEQYLTNMGDLAKREYYGGLLINEYLSIDNIDKAIHVFDNITGHCSMYQMQYKGFNESAAYTEKYAKKIYDALLKEGRYDEAWNYHALSYHEIDHPRNAPDYFAYMSDVILSMCNAGLSAEASKFIRQKGIWFIKNVDNHELGEDYPEYAYEIMRSKLNKVFNEVQF